MGLGNQTIYLTIGVLHNTSFLITQRFGVTLYNLQWVKWKKCGNANAQTWSQNALYH